MRARVLFAVGLLGCGAAAPAPEPHGPVASPPSDAASRNAVEALEAYLKIDRTLRPPLSAQPFAKVALSSSLAERARQALWDDHVAAIRATRAAEISALELHDGEYAMKLFIKTFGAKPAH